MLYVSLQTGGTDRCTDGQTNIAYFHKSITDRQGRTDVRRDRLTLPVSKKRITDSGTDRRTHGQTNRTPLLDNRLIWETG